MDLWRSPRLGKSGRSPLVNAYVRNVRSQGRSPLAAEHDDAALLEVASVEDCVPNRDGR